MVDVIEVCFESNFTPCLDISVIESRKISAERKRNNLWLKQTSGTVRPNAVSPRTPRRVDSISRAEDKKSSESRGMVRGLRELTKLKHNNNAESVRYSVLAEKMRKPETTL